MMQYIVSFLEGIITFISPCLLPMIPVYISYFAGGGERSGKNTLISSLGFVLGFSIVFVVLGAFAGTVGAMLGKYRTAVNIVSGMVVIVLGLNFLGVFKLNIFNFNIGYMKKSSPGFWSSLIFGVTFSIGWTPCVGAFLGSALMLVAQQGQVLKGIIMLLLYSAGLGIPFVISALLIEQLKSAFDFMKKHYAVVNIISGVFLVVVGFLMAFGTFGEFLSMLS